MFIKVNKQGKIQMNYWLSLLMKIEYIAEK